jgi:signal transduction histidine kinase
MKSLRLLNATAGQQIGVLLVIVFVLLAANVTASTWLSSQSEEFADRTLSEQQLKAVVLRILSGMQDVETGMRGFLLTEDEAYLEPFRKGVESVPGELDALQDLGRDDPFVREEARDIAKLAEARIAVASRTIELYRAEPAEGLALLRSGKGKRLMDQIRARAATLSAHQDREIVKRVDSLRDSSRWSDITNVGSLILIVLMAIVSGFLVRRYVNEIEAGRSDVARMNEGLERVLQERTGEIVRANEEIQQFAYIVSHDLRAPLVNIMGFTSELESIGDSMKKQLDKIAEQAPEDAVEEGREALDVELPEAISFIRASTTKMDRLINAILKLSREGRRNLKPVRVDMNEVAQGIADSLKHQTTELEAEIEIKSLPDLVTDKLAIEQVMTNLVENAVKYLASDRKGRIVVRGREDGPFNEYRVEDNGRGIADADRERVFELFRRAGAQDTKGEGMGLAFVRTVIRRLGGSIDLQSEVGVGTTMTLRLPKVLSQKGSED